MDMDTSTFVAFDTETHLTRPGCQIPPMVCLSVADKDSVEVLHRRDPRCEETVRVLIDAALAGVYHLVGQNVAFDLAVIANEWPDLLPKVFALYDNDRILDTMIRQKLLDIAAGCYRGERDGSTKVWTPYQYNLAALAKRYEYPVELDKDTWRLRYNELDSISVREWPQEAIDYSAHDAKSTLWSAIQQERTRCANVYLKDQFRQNRAGFALHLVSAWGIRTDPVMCAVYRKKTEERIMMHQKTLIDRGFLRQHKGAWKKEQKKMQEYVRDCWLLQGNEEFPITKGGKPALDEDAVVLLDDPIARAYQEWSSSSTILGKVEEWEQGIYLPIHSYFDELMETGRTSSSNPPLQNRPTKPGDRECAVPRKGFVYCDEDYSGLELCTLSQVCIDLLGRSRLGEVLNEGGDPHSMIGAQILGIQLEEALRRKKNKEDKEYQYARQTGKVANFGLGGGLGYKTLIRQAKKEYDVVLDEDSAKNLIRIWKETWPEMEEYHKTVKAWVENGGSIAHVRSERVRGMISFTVAANSMFQGLGADTTKKALYDLVKETYIGRSILRGCRVVNFVHDEYITEVPEECARECAKAKAELVMESAKSFLPDVPPKVEIDLSRRWSKLAGSEKEGVITNGIWEWNEAIRAGAVGCID